MNIEDRLHAIVDPLPSGAAVTLPADTLRAWLAEEWEPSALKEPEPTVQPTSWRVLLWTVDSETRIGRAELLEAVGRPASWLYRHTGPSAEARIPHRKLDGGLVFVVGEVRAWLREREEVVEAGPVMESLRIAGGGR